jgi:hypothetical protein
MVTLGIGNPSCIENVSTIEQIFAVEVVKVKLPAGRFVAVTIESPTYT